VIDTSKKRQNRSSISLAATVSKSYSARVWRPAVSVAGAGMVKGYLDDQAEGNLRDNVRLATERYLSRSTVITKRNFKGETFKLQE